MKVKYWDLKLIWEDGEENEVSSYVPTHLVRAVEEFIDYWEEQHGEDDDEDEEDDDE